LLRAALLGFTSFVLGGVTNGDHCAFPPPPKRAPVKSFPGHPFFFGLENDPSNSWWLTRIDFLFDYCVPHLPHLGHFNLVSHDVFTFGNVESARSAHSFAFGNSPSCLRVCFSPNFMCFSFFSPLIYFFLCFPSFPSHGPVSDFPVECFVQRKREIPDRFFRLFFRSPGVSRRIRKFFRPPLPSFRVVVTKPYTGSFLFGLRTHPPEITLQPSSFSFLRPFRFPLPFSLAGETFFCFCRFSWGNSKRRSCVCYMQPLCLA